MYKASLLSEIKYDNSFKMASDFDLQLQILEKAPIVSIHEVLYFYRSHNTNLCKSVSNQERLKIMDTIIKKHSVK